MNPVGRPPVTHLLYLHGFRSSPRSAKAQRTAAWVREHHPALAWWCPQLPASPAQAMALLREGVRGWPAERTGVIGSSLGGFYATELAQSIGARAVLLNPAVDPARDLVRYIGENRAWHSDDAFFFRSEYIDELRSIGPTPLRSAQDLYAVIAKGDEVLSWVEMAQRYAACRQCLIEGGDHALSDFEAHLPSVMDFLGLALSSTSEPASTRPVPTPPR